MVFLLRICSIVIKTLISIQPKLLHTYNVLQPRSKEHDMCFEILGFDIFIDENIKPWLIEVNHMPSFNQDTKVDKECKQVHECLNFSLSNLGIHRN